MVCVHMAPSSPNPSPPRFDPDAICRHLGAAAQGWQLELLPECDSTNTRLMARPLPADPRPECLLAERQTAGRGRRGRAWVAPAGGSLAFSVRWRLPAGRSPLGLSLAVGVALARALHGLDVGGLQLKWPNDLLVAGRKLGGILIELASGREGTAAVIGVGINLSLPPDLRIEGAVPPADLASALAAPLDGNAVFAACLAALGPALESFGRHGFAAFRAEWNLCNAHAGQAVTLHADAAAPLAGICRGVDEDGALLLETPAGVQRVLAGDVSLRVPPGSGSPQAGPREGQAHPGRPGASVSTP